MRKRQVRLARILQNSERMSFPCMLPLGLYDRFIRLDWVEGRQISGVAKRYPSNRTLIFCVMAYQLKVERVALNALGCGRSKTSALRAMRSTFQCIAKAPFDFIYE